MDDIPSLLVEPLDGLRLTPEEEDILTRSEAESIGILLAQLGASMFTYNPPKWTLAAVLTKEQYSHIWSELDRAGGWTLADAYAVCGPYGYWRDSLLEECLDCASRKDAALLSDLNEDSREDLLDLFTAAFCWPKWYQNVLPTEEVAETARMHFQYLYPEEWIARCTGTDLEVLNTQLSKVTACAGRAAAKRVKTLRKSKPAPASAVRPGDRALLKLFWPEICTDEFLSTWHPDTAPFASLNELICAVIDAAPSCQPDQQRSELLAAYADSTSRNLAEILPCGGFQDVGDARRVLEDITAYMQQETVRDMVLRGLKILPASIRQDLMSGRITQTPKDSLPLSLLRLPMQAVCRLRRALHLPSLYRILNFLYPEPVLRDRITAWTEPWASQLRCLLQLRCFSRFRAEMRFCAKQYPRFGMSNRGVALVLEADPGGTCADMYKKEKDGMRKGCFAMLFMNRICETFDPRSPVYLCMYYAEAGVDTVSWLIDPDRPQAVKEEVEAAMPECMAIFEDCFRRSKDYDTPKGIRELLEKYRAEDLESYLREAGLLKPGSREARMLQTYRSLPSLS